MVEKRGVYPHIVTAQCGTQRSSQRTDMNLSSDGGVGSLTHTLR
jgi:hypothetical protein